MIGDARRPQFHFTARSGWINDPHGITYRDGGYDVFFQYVPGAMTWQPNCHWGHARGQDLLSLRELPVAIAPGDGDDGIWSGSLAIGADGRPTAFYTATNVPDFGIGRIRTATASDPDWITWVKGPVVAEAPTDVELAAYRDPFVRREGDRWRMFVGAGAADGTAMALTYIGDDVATWRYDGVALARSTHEKDPIWTGALWECPQVFEIGGRFAMVSSVWEADNLHYAAYALGSYSEGRFTAESWGRLTYGPSYYAPSLFYDAQHRPCLSFWMRGVADSEGGWAGAHSVPHLLGLDGELLIATPHPDLERYQVAPDRLEAGEAQAMDVTWRPGPGDELDVRRGDDPVVYLSCTQHSVTVVVAGTEWTVPRTQMLRLIIDGPVLELATGAGNFGVAIGVPAGALTLHHRGTPPHTHALVR